MEAADLTAPMRARDREIESLRDLVMDLLFIARDECCALRDDLHEVDCPVIRAQRVLRQRS